ncbi:hypothetical protein ACFL56_03370, partial [Candidatus Margulisiibacteriota bacterium]
ELEYTLPNYLRVTAGGFYSTVDQYNFYGGVSFALGVHDIEHEEDLSQERVHASVDFYEQRNRLSDYAIEDLLLALIIDPSLKDRILPLLKEHPHMSLAIINDVIRNTPDMNIEAYTILREELLDELRSQLPEEEHIQQEIDDALAIEDSAVREDVVRDLIIGNEDDQQRTVEEQEERLEVVREVILELPPSEREELTVIMAEASQDIVTTIEEDETLSASEEVQLIEEAEDIAVFTTDIFIESGDYAVTDIPSALNEFYNTVPSSRDPIINSFAEGLQALKEQLDVLRTLSEQTDTPLERLSEYQQLRASAEYLLEDLIKNFMLLSEPTRQSMIHCLSLISPLSEQFVFHKVEELHRGDDPLSITLQSLLDRKSSVEQRIQVITVSLEEHDHSFRQRRRLQSELSDIEEELEELNEKIDIIEQEKEIIFDNYIHALASFDTEYMYYQFTLLISNYDYFTRRYSYYFQSNFFNYLGDNDMALQRLFESIYYFNQSREDIYHYWISTLEAFYQSGLVTDDEMYIIIRDYFNLDALEYDFGQTVDFTNISQAFRYLNNPDPSFIHTTVNLVTIDIFLNEHIHLLVGFIRDDKNELARELFLSWLSDTLQPLYSRLELTSDSSLTLHLEDMVTNLLPTTDAYPAFTTDDVNFYIQLYRKIRSLFGSQHSITSRMKNFLASLYQSRSRIQNVSVRQHLQTQCLYLFPCPAEVGNDSHPCF